MKIEVAGMKGVVVLWDPNIQVEIWYIGLGLNEEKLACSTVALWYGIVIRTNC
jgi:hypothetical protein